MAVNLKQITNQTAPIFKATPSLSPYFTVNLSGVERILFPGKTTKIRVKYYRIEFNNNYSVWHLGYCCSPTGIGVPIYVTFLTGPEQSPIYIGKTGIFEFMPEEFKDINIAQPEEISCIPFISKIWVPFIIDDNYPINFTVDFSVVVN